jgi:eukaryotic-like serine/threonine-protein kinase
VTSATVIGKYQLIRKLATGGMAEVFLARVAGPGGFEKTVVLKRILPHLAEDQAFVQMFLEEARLAAQLNHPNVVSIFDFGQEGDQYVMVMEYIDGPNLRALYRRALELAQPLPFALAAKIVSFACEGLAYAHDFADPATGAPMNLVHRDISPDNILLGRNGGVKVVDFGIAKAANQEHHTKTGTIKGKFAYMPPEQLKGAVLDRRADIFALGIVLYELVTGQKPFESNSDAMVLQAILYEPMRPASMVRADTPPALQKIIDHALEKNRDARYGDCRELQADLEAFIVSQGAPVGQYQLAQLVQKLAGAATPAVPPTATPPPRPSQVGLGAVATPAPSSPALDAILPPPPPQGTAVTTPIGLKAQGTVLPPPPALAPPPVAEPEVGSVSVNLSSVSGTPPVPASELVKQPEPKGFPAWAVVLTVGVLLLGAGGWVLLRQRAAVEPPGPATEFHDAGAEVAMVIEPPRPLPLPEEPKPVEPPPDSPAPEEPVVEAAVDAGLPAVVAVVVKDKKDPKRKDRRPTFPAIKKADPKPEPTAAAPDATTGEVEFRVRPYASVFVNGKPYGDTPFNGPLVLPVGKITVKLVNKELNKDVTLPFEVKPGKNAVRYNFEE